MVIIVPVTVLVPLPLSSPSPPCCRPRWCLSPLVYVSLWCHLPIPIPVVVLPCSLPPNPLFSPRNPPCEQLLAAVVGVTLCWWWWSSSSWFCCSPVPHHLIIFSPCHPHLRAVVILFPFSPIVSFSFHHCFISFLHFFSLSAPSTLRARGSQVRGRAVLSLLLSSAA